MAAAARSREIWLLAIRARLRPSNVVVHLVHFLSCTERKDTESYRALSMDILQHENVRQPALDDPYLFENSNVKRIN